MNRLSIVIAAFYFEDNRADRAGNSKHAAKSCKCPVSVLVGIGTAVAITGAIVVIVNLLRASLVQCYRSNSQRYSCKSYVLQGPGFFCFFYKRCDLYIFCLHHNVLGLAFWDLNSLVLKT